MEWEVIHGQPVAKANHYQAVPDGAGGRRIIKDAAVRAYERKFRNQCKTYAGRAVDVEFYLFVKVYFMSRANDLDNTLKTLLDCLQYVGAIKDDNLCVQIRAEKRIDAHRPRIEFAILPTVEDMFHQSSIE